MPRRALATLSAVSILVIAVAWWIDDRLDGGNGPRAAEERALSEGRDPSDPPETTTTTKPPYDGWSDPTESGAPWPESTVTGLLTFRGNPTRSYYGTGPVPRSVAVDYRFPSEGGMCGVSTNLGVTKTWCGLGWTGQPVIAERDDGRTWVVFGGYDGALHFMDAATGQRILPDFPTGDLIKGTPTIDPDGYPLVYSGSRDNYTRIISIQGAEPVELWKFHSEDVQPTMWNDDWDSSPMIIDDYFFQGGENSQFVVFKLNRGYAADGTVTVAPELVWNTPSWTQALLDAIGDETVSVEVSPTVVGNTLYFANSGGRVQGYDLSGLADGVAPGLVFDFWTGDDTDASIVADTEGMLYVAVEYERPATAARSQVVGQLVKLDPTNAANPIVWSVDDTGVRPGGMWATPAIGDGVVYAATNGGQLLGVDQATGAVLWSKTLPGPLWGSPVVVDGVLLEGDCDGGFHAYDVSDPRIDPPVLWSLDLGGCIEATPAVWDGKVYIGSRDGFLYVLSEPAPAVTSTTSEP